MDTLSKKRIELLGYDLYRRCSNGELVSETDLSKRLTKIRKDYPSLTLDKLISECQFSQLKESDDKFKKSNVATTRLLDKIMEENVLPRDIVENILFDYMGPKKEKDYHDFYSTKLKAEYYVIDGKKHGESKEYDENGKLFQQVNYTNGEENGPFIEYHENGKIARTATYKNGELNGEVKNFDERGNLKASLMFKKNKFNGVSTFYDADGNKSHEFMHKDNEAIWKKSYYPNGQLREQKTYKKFMPDTVRAWREDGTEIKFPRLVKY